MMLLHCTIGRRVCTYARMHARTHAQANRSVRVHSLALGQLVRQIPLPLEFRRPLLAIVGQGGWRKDIILSVCLVDAPMSCPA